MLCVVTMEDAAESRVMQQQVVMSRTAPKQGRSRYKPPMKVTQANKHIISTSCPCGYLYCEPRLSEKCCQGTTFYSMEAAQDAMHLAHQMQAY